MVHLSLLLATNEPAQQMWDKFGPSLDESFKAEVNRIRQEPIVPR